MTRDEPVGLCRLDTELRYVQINRRLARLNGIPMEAHIGVAIREILPNVFEAAESQLRHVLATGEPIILGQIFVETAAHPGVKRHYIHNCHPCYLPDPAREGIVVGIRCAVQDVTNLQSSPSYLFLQLERLRERAEHFTTQFAAILPAFIFVLTHTDGDGYWEGSRVQIAEASGRSVRATQRALRWLEQMDLATIDRSHKGLRIQLVA